MVQQILQTPVAVIIIIASGQNLSLMWEHDAFHLNFNILHMKHILEVRGITVHTKHATGHLMVN